MNVQKLIVAGIQWYNFCVYQVHHKNNKRLPSTQQKFDTDHTESILLLNSQIGWCVCCQRMGMGGSEELVLKNHRLVAGRNH